MSGYGIKKSEGRSNPIIITKENAISKGRYINRIEFRESDKAQWLNIEVRDKDGNTARRSYFPAKIGLYIKDNEALEKELQKFNRTIRNLTHVLLSPNYETGETASFKDFCLKVISDIGKAYVDKELRVKLVYDDKNRPSLPKYPIMFEDPITISDENSKMSVNQYDKVEPSIVEMDKDKPTDDILSLEKKKTGESDDGLPF